jgi:hypothetical protein
MRKREGREEVKINEEEEGRTNNPRRRLKGKEGIEDHQEEVQQNVSKS